MKLRCVVVALGVSAACGAQQMPSTTDAGALATNANEPIACEAATLGEPGSIYRAWVAAPNTHPNVPNVSFAGYRYGADLPALGDKPHVRVIDFGAVANSDADASDAVAAAIAAVARDGGVVEFPAGALHFRRPIALQDDGVVLVGAGSDRTRLVFDQALNDAYAKNTRDASSRWSWSGGLIWLSPRALRAFPAASAEIGDPWQEGWTVTGDARAVEPEAMRGDTQITLADVGGVVVGQRIAIELDANEALLQHLSGDGDYARAQGWSIEDAGWLLPPLRPTVLWPVEVVAVDGNAITLAQPLRFDLRAAWSPRVRMLGPVVSESGVVGISIVMAREDSYVTKRDHHHEVGWNGVMIENAWNCFVADIKVVDAENGVLLSSAKNITVRDFSIDASDAGHSLQHHGTVTRESSHDNLFEDFTITAQPVHGINVESFSMGNVWSRGTLDHGTWDTHRGLAAENVITELMIHNDGEPGGRSDAGPRMGVRQTVWNVQVTNDECNVIGQPHLMPRGTLVGLRGCTPSAPANSEALVVDSGLTSSVPSPDNLYLAQRALRLCAHSLRTEEP